MLAEVPPETKKHVRNYVKKNIVSNRTAGYAGWMFYILLY